MISWVDAKEVRRDRLRSPINDSPRSSSSEHARFAIRTAYRDTVATVCDPQYCVPRCELGEAFSLSRVDYICLDIYGNEKQGLVLLFCLRFRHWIGVSTTKF